MTDIIKRLEAATEGSRELDARIGAVVSDYERTRQPTSSESVEPGHFWEGKAPESLQHAPHYTTSIDAALTLVPEGYRWRLWYHHTGYCGADIFPDKGGILSKVHDAPTAALALCIAALKAREAASNGELK